VLYQEPSNQFSQIYHKITDSPPTKKENPKTPKKNLKFLTINLINGEEANSLGHVGGNVLKLGVCFHSGKWQSVSQWGLVFGFGFRFGLLYGYVVYWFRVRAKVLRLIAFLWYLV
jgi:hypothetical protein